MESLKHIKLGVGFLIFLGTPSYLVYDVRRLAEGNVTPIHWLLLVFALGLALTAIIFLFRLRGERYVRFKPLWERPLALVILILTSPLLLLTALIIRLESSGPAIYLQKRAGRNRRRGDRRETAGSLSKPPKTDRRSSHRRENDLGGRPFTMCKFRSMVEDAEAKTGAAWSTGDHDPRVTRVGYYMRKSHFDELPQFFNVVVGDMSIVGPRPERPEFIRPLANTIDDYRDRLVVFPGITGLAQVRQRHDESIEDVKKKIESDREYIENISFALDCRIMLQTVVLVLDLFWKALKRRTIRRKIEPKSADAILQEFSHLKR